MTDTPAPAHFCTDYSPDIQAQGDCRNCGHTHATHHPAMPSVQEAVKVLLDACARREPMVAAYDDDVFLSPRDLHQFRDALTALSEEAKP